VFGVVLACAIAVELHQLHCSNHVAASLDARRDFADEPAQTASGLQRMSVRSIAIEARYGA